MRKRKSYQELRFMRIMIVWCIPGLLEPNCALTAGHVLPVRRSVSIASLKPLIIVNLHDS